MRVKNVAEWLDLSASKYPNKVAFSNGKYEFTFSQLQHYAKAIGSELARRGLFKKPIVIAIDKEPKAIACFLGCAYSGNFYVPLDLEMPESRVQKIHDKLQPALTINYDNYEDFALSEIDDLLLEDVSCKQIDTDLLYVLFTSGSTGTPKGVAVQHRGVIDYSDKIKEVFGFNEDTIHGQSVPLFFDSSILPVYQTIMNGGSDYIISKTALMFAAKTVDFLNEHKCNAIYWVPTSYSIVAKSGIFAKRIPNYLNKCLFVGEVMPTSVLNIWRKALPNAQFINLMGPTEITGTYLYYKVEREFNNDEALPIGMTYPNVQALLLNDRNEECKVGEIGELCVRGSKVSCGYYNDPERTAQVFVQNPLNSAYNELIYRTGDLGYFNERGEIMFAGRKDFQIKLSGHRIELGEIEVATCSIDGVDLCGCVFDSEKQRLVLFYQGGIEEKEVRTVLKQKLQPYMVPDIIAKIDKMPRTGSGKISRTELKQKLSEY